MFFVTAIMPQYIMNALIISAIVFFVMTTCLIICCSVLWHRLGFGPVIIAILGLIATSFCIASACLVLGLWKTSAHGKVSLLPLIEELPRQLKDTIDAPPRTHILLSPCLPWSDSGRNRINIMTQMAAVFLTPSKIDSSMQTWNNGTLYTGAPVGQGLSGCSNKSICISLNDKSLIVSVFKTCNDINFESTQGIAATQIVVSGQCPNLVMQYAFIGPASIALEYANGGTLTALASANPSPQILCTLILQTLLGLLGLKLANLSHWDLHWDNVFLFKVDKCEQFWHYQLEANDIFVPNLGYLACVADYGGTHALTAANEAESFHRFFGPYNANVKCFTDFQHNYSSNFVNVMNVATQQSTLLQCVQSIVSGAKSIGLMDYTTSLGTSINALPYLSQLS